VEVVLETGAAVAVLVAYCKATLVLLLVLLLR